ncbi:MAG: mechanosensitive ion channel family protein [Candidatus Enterenecus sp.]
MKKGNRSKIIRLAVCLVILAAGIAAGLLTNLFNMEDLKRVSLNLSALARALIMAVGVITAEALISLILSLPKPKSHRARSLLSIISSLLKYTAGIVILCWGLSILGVNVSTIVASVGILALIVGFSAESLIADVVTGAFMIFENQYNVGDIVEVDNFRGTVTSIGIRTTCITDPGDNVKIVNNSAMKNILNRSDKLSRSVSDISVPYATDLEKLESQIPALMQSIFEQHPDMMKNPPRYLGVQSLADSAVILRFVVEVDEKDLYSGARVLNHDLLLGFRRLGVECPFPQLDVHTD